MAARRDRADRGGRVVPAAAPAERANQGVVADPAQPAALTAPRRMAPTGAAAQTSAARAVATTMAVAVVPPAAMAAAPAGSAGSAAAPVAARRTEAGARS
ncbi:MAG TPA: hypothetical protein VE465_17920 [Streptosporangiaceae bacterium]|nr:hypothetical protein [Streptosporangiaceae bacterium]